MHFEQADSALPVAASGSSDGPTPLEIEVTELFNEFRAPLLRYLGSFGVTAQDGEEVVQEVFLALFLHLRDGKPRTNLQGWLFRVAHNLGLKRCQANRNTVADAQEVIAADPTMDPEQLVASQQRRNKLLGVVRALPEQDRRCLYLRAEGLRYREITEVLGMSLGAVAQSLARSLERLSQVDLGELG